MSDLVQIAIATASGPLLIAATALLLSWRAYNRLDRALSRLERASEWKRQILSSGE